MAAKCFQEMTECRRGPGLRRDDDGQNEGGLQEMGCDNASFMKSRAAVMEAISLFTKVDVAEIKCVGNSVQATDVEIYYTKVSVSGEEKTCRILRMNTAANGKGWAKTFDHVDIKTGKIEES